MVIARPMIAEVTELPVEDAKALEAAVDALEHPGLAGPSPASSASRWS
jgi:hypothetical protein